MSIRQRGFTMIELLTASAAAGIVIVAASAFLLRALTWYDELAGKIEMNRHARETFDLMAYGGMAAATGKDGTKYLYGLRGSNKAPAAPAMRTANAALQYTNNKLTLTPDSFSPMTIKCAGDGVPVPDCKASGPQATQTVQGWMGSDMTLDGGPKAVNNLTVDVTFTVTDPFEAQRATAPGQFTDTYRTIFTLNRDEDDPH